MLAPKVTHQIWMQGWDKLPEKFHENVQRLHELNPEFEHKQWTDATLREECATLGPEYLAKYDSFTILMSRVDFGRYVILYKYGGISVDTDMESLRPLRDTPGLDTYDCMISASAVFPKFCNLVNSALIICTQHHPVMKHIIDTIATDTSVPSNYPLQELYVTSTTGPVFMSSIIYRFPDKIHLLDNKYFEPCFSGDMFCSNMDDSIMNHRHELSWMNPTTKYIVKHLPYILLAFLCIFLVVQYKTIVFRAGLSLNEWVRMGAKHFVSKVGYAYTTTTGSLHKSTDMGR